MSSGRAGGFMAFGGLVEDPVEREIKSLKNRVVELEARVCELENSTDDTPEVEYTRVVIIKGQDDTPPKGAIGVWLVEDLDNGSVLLKVKATSTDEDSLGWIIADITTKDIQVLGSILEEEGYPLDEAGRWIVTSGYFE